jgi:hypothetical protein
MGAVGRAKGVIDIDLGGAEQFLGESRIIFFLFRVEADVFQDQNLARLEIGPELVGLGAHAVCRKLYRTAERLGEVRGYGLEGILLLRLALGPPKVAGENKGGPSFEEQFKSGEGFLNPGIVRNFRSLGRGLERDVKIHPDENLFALGLEILDGQLGHDPINPRCA